ncbi:hypothetical protein C0991_007156 [Blastosporella zonata]|nr:hypothetical protein C0991_007156 [Blastosporella zonata]
MLSYIAVNVPPFDKDFDSDEWSVVERATWLVMNASTSALIQITHIQFLTLLYPSRLEGRLIFTLLGPLAVVAAVMQLIPINESPNANSVASAVRNVCNATLSLLFTASLFIWGLLVNRKNAWRTDGGTAAFGAGALALALVSTALNFLYVNREEEYVWLPSLMWAVILWQSFLGWWWWVGAGSASGLSEENDIFERLEREAKREARRKQAKERRRENKLRAKKVWKGVTGAFHAPGNRNQATMRRFNTKSSPPSTPPDSVADSAHNKPQPAMSESSASTNGSLSTLPRILPPIVHQWYASLRHAHLLAARQQAADRVARIRERERNGTADAGMGGWGLGSFAWRIGRENNLPPPNQDFEMYNHFQWSPQHDKASDEQDEGARDIQPQAVPKPPTPTPRAVPPPAPRQRSMWWWGPLARWRLQDSTSY